MNKKWNLPQCVVYMKMVCIGNIGFQLLIECLLLINMSFSKWNFRSNEPLMMMVIRLRGSPTIFELVSLLIFPVNFDCLIFWHDHHGSILRLLYVLLGSKFNELYLPLLKSWEIFLCNDHDYNVMCYVIDIVHIFCSGTSSRHWWL